MQVLEAVAIVFALSLAIVFFVVVATLMTMAILNERGVLKLDDLDLIGVIFAFWAAFDFAVGAAVTVALGHLPSAIVFAACSAYFAWVAWRNFINWRNKRPRRKAERWWGMRVLHNGLKLVVGEA